ncbi:MAG TPA: sulfatase-like hydrolase/transferase, partial [Actinomycetota bacterium]|nr:sulfatase-like hydrolase/transferase [Actinomycetota bacterium]
MQPDVLVIICDTARADAFRPWDGPHPTPAMERLAREGIVYSQATSQAPWTLPSTASIFSGKLPTEHGISGDCFEWTDGRPSSPGGAVRGFDGPWLPETFRERGYRTWGASCNIWISPWGGFDRGFDEFDHLHDKVRLPQGKVGNLLRKARRLYGKVDRGGRQAVEAFGRQYAVAGSRPL